MVQHQNGVGEDKIIFYLFILLDYKLQPTLRTVNRPKLFNYNFLSWKGGGECGKKDLRSRSKEGKGREGTWGMKGRDGHGNRCRDCFSSLTFPTCLHFLSPLPGPSLLFLYIFSLSIIFSLYLRPSSSYSSIHNIIIIIIIKYISFQFNWSIHSLLQTPHLSPPTSCLSAWMCVFYVSLPTLPPLLHFTSPPCPTSLHLPSPPFTKLVPTSLLLCFLILFTLFFWFPYPFFFVLRTYIEARENHVYFLTLQKIIFTCPGFLTVCADFIFFKPMWCVDLSWRDKTMKKPNGYYLY